MNWTKERLEKDIGRLGFELDEESSYYWTIGYSFENVWYTLVSLDMRRPILMDTLAHEDHISDLMDDRTSRFNDEIFLDMMNIVYNFVTHYSKERQIK